MFENTHISFLLYLVLLIGSLIIVTLSVLYLAWCYYFGKPLAPFFWLRIKGWTNPRTALFQIFTLTNNVIFKEARRETGDGYKFYIPPKIDVPSDAKPKSRLPLFKKVKDIFFNFNKIGDYTIKKIEKVQTLIIPKSVYSINGVKTILLWDLHPALHTDILQGVEALLKQDITTLEQFEDCISNPEVANKKLFNQYTYKNFYDLYIGAKNKYSVKVTTDDVLNIVGRNFDKNFRESIEAKDYNALQKARIDNKYIKYGYAAIILAILIVGIRVIYLTIFA